MQNWISEANVQTNRMMSTKWTYHKERNFTSNYFIFLKILLQFKNLLQKSWFDIPTTQMLIFVLSVSAGVLFDGAFSLWVSLKVVHFVFYKQLGLGPSPQSCLYFQDFQGSKLLSSCYRNLDCSKRNSYWIANFCFSLWL